MMNNRKPACSPPDRSRHSVAGPARVPELIRMLREDGWRLSAWHGGHRQYQHPVKRGTVTVSRSSETSVTRGALNSILKQAGATGDPRP